ncbi:hypothetical protein ACIPOG_00020 [Kriegella sp. LARHCF250]
MRATYEDLLRTARRRAVEAEKAAESDTTDLVAGWQATLTAARHHFRWLRLELTTVDFVEGRPRQACGPMHALAQSIGAGGDLLATQHGSSTLAFDNKGSLIAARSELAAITAIGARAALTRLAVGLDTLGSRAELHQHLTEVVAELRFHSVRRTRPLGQLGRLTTALPDMPRDDPSSVMRLAALWQAAHEATSPRDLLTRDLRSTTAQLRTVCGYASHLGTVLGAVQPGTDERLRALEPTLRSADLAAARVGRAWRTRLSDVNGRSDGPAEATFLEMLRTLQRWLRDGDRLRRPDEIVRDEHAGATIRDVVDELLHAAHRVAALHQKGVAWLIDAGRLFVPRPELAKRDPEYWVRPTVWLLRYPQPSWIRTNRRACFDELSEAIADMASHLAAAAEIARGMAGSSGQTRPLGPAHVTKPSGVRKSLWQPIEPAYADLIPAIAEQAGPER